MNVVSKYSNYFNSELPLVKKVLQEICGFLSNSLPNISTDLKSEFKLIFSELLCNAIIHGNNNDISKHVYIQIEVAGDIVSSTIKDEGIGFDYKNFISSLKNNKDISLNENGRGIWLVYSLSDTVSFNPEGNEIKFLKRCKDE